VHRYKPAPVEHSASIDIERAPIASSAPVVSYEKSKPINEAIILPAIHAQGGEPPPKLNGIGAMNRQFSHGRQNEQNNTSEQ